ncbi:MAG: signal peptidase I [Myxococcota bacterium]
MKDQGAVFRWIVGGLLFATVLPSVWLVRALFVEPFRIPSAGEAPTLAVGDHVLVDKARYGLSLPSPLGDGRTRLLDLGVPERGEIVVFRYPEDPSIHYIKRVVAVGGDRIAVEDHQVRLNGAVQPWDEVGPDTFVDDTCTERAVTRFTEQGPRGTWDIFTEDGASSRLANVRERTVPAGHVFVMGDNRDHSEDSRVWGFVPLDHIIGRAERIWFSFDACEGRLRQERVGTSVLPEGS